MKDVLTKTLVTIKQYIFVYSDSGRKKRFTSFMNWHVYIHHSNVVLFLLRMLCACD